MKSTITLIIALITCVSSVFAQNSNAIFFTENGERFTVVLNGIRQNASPETNVKITDLNAPNYKLRVIFTDRSLGILDKNLYLEPGTERTFVIKQNKKGIYVLRMNSEVAMAQAPPPSPQQQVIVFTTTPPPATATVTTQTTSTTTTGNAPAASENVSLGVNVGGTNVGINVNVQEGGGTGTATSTTTTTTTTTTTSGTITPQPAPQPAQPVYHLPGYTGPIGCPMPMTDSEFSGVKSSIASKSFDDSKLTIAKQVIGSNCLLSSQVKEIMILFSFEDTRLDIAKYAYGYTYDLGNYYKVNDAFDFESTIDELNEYINSVNR